MLSLVKAGLAVGCAVIVAGCAAQEKTGPTAKAPDVTVSCIGVLPVRPAADMDEPRTGAESKNLQDGAAILDALLKESLRNRKDVRSAPRTDIPPYTAVIQSRHAPEPGLCKSPAPP